MPNTIKTSKIIDIRKETCIKVHFVVGGDDFHQVPEAFTLHDTQRHIVGDNHVRDRLCDLLLLTASNFRGLLTKDVRGTCFNVSFIWVFLFSDGCLNLRWLLRLEVPPWSCSVVKHRLHVADFLSAAFVKNLNTWDAVGGILNVDRMRSSVFNVDVDWMSNWLRMTMFYPKPNVWLRRSSNEVFVTYVHGKNTLFWLPPLNRGDYSSQIKTRLNNWLTMD